MVLMVYSQCYLHYDWALGLRSLDNPVHCGVKCWNAMVALVSNPKGKEGIMHTCYQKQGYTHTPLSSPSHLKM